MALFIDSTDRLLIPTWREFDKSLSELQPIDHYKHPIGKGDISESIAEWEGNKNLVNAGELITAAIINGFTEDPTVIDAASYVLEYPLNVPKVLANVSKEILASPITNNDVTDDRLLIFAKIANLKRLLSDYPACAVLYIEIARWYVLLGQLDIAEKHINTALYLDCHNRYIVRSAARFFIHRNKGEAAIAVLRRSGLTKKDPWLMASEISVSRQFDKRSPFLKKAFQLVESKDFSDFDLSELRGTIGMEELENNGFKKSRQLFNQSLVAANDNSFAQAQWVANNRNLELLFPNAPINVLYKEALCYDKFFEGDYKSALQYAIQWQDEVPYSLKCVMFGSGISTTFEKDYKTSIRLLNNYLRTNQRNKAALNDLAYAYALNNDTINAQKTIDIATKEIDKTRVELADICLVATQGLVFFREGDEKKGSYYYERAIEASRMLQMQEMLDSAKLNYSREILRFSNTSDSRAKVESILERIPQYPQATPNYLLRKEIELMLIEPTYLPESGPQNGE